MREQRHNRFGFVFFGFVLGLIPGFINVQEIRLRTDADAQAAAVEIADLRKALQSQTETAAKEIELRLDLQARCRQPLADPFAK